MQAEILSGASNSSDSWERVPRLLRELAAPLPSPWEDIFGSLRAGRVDDLVVVGQVGQSLDGRLATATGRSHYINGPAGLAHLHRPAAFHRARACWPMARAES
jgi:diaminohydroxyphosphoribosylaminopyrimidine deaminase/5-amino-6-(5-phosphoribosylamino)uracil reductase